MLPLTTNQPVKQRIRRIKTQHNQSAKINQTLLYEETKKLHKDNINYAIYADDKSDQLFPLKQVDIEFVQSYTFKEDSKFKEIRHLLQKYNQEVLRYDDKSAPGLHLKTKVIDSMLKFMRLMFQAPDSTAKKRILDVSYYWFKKNLDTQKGKNRSKQSLEKEIRTIVIESNLVPKSIIDKQLPSQKRKEELHHYQILARTKYPQTNPPAVQLEDFVTHKLGYVNHGIKNEELNAASKSKEEIREDKWRQRVLFKKPIIYEQNYDTEEGERQNEELKTKINEVQASLTSPQNNTEQPPQNGQQPNTQLTLEQQNQAAMQQIDMGIPDQGDPVEEQPAEPQQQDKKRGKLDPLVKIFLRDRQKRIKTQGEVTTQQKYHHTQQWKLTQQRLDEVNAKFMTQWGGNRSRFKSELSRKIQSIRTFTSVSKAKQEATSISANPLRVQNTIYKSKLSETLKQYGSYIRHQPPANDSLNAQKSMSVYDRKRMNTQASSTLKHFSAVLQDNKRIDKNSEFLDEIQRLKEKFAKYKLYAPLESFKNAIIHPEQKESNWAELDKQLSEGIQLPRCQMLSNPFFKVAKKKKKKGKKKN